MLESNGSAISPIQRKEIVSENNRINSLTFFIMYYYAFDVSYFDITKECGKSSQGFQQ